MADKTRENKSDAPGPGDEDWERNQAVIEGRVDPTAPDKTDPNLETEKDSDKK